MQRQTSCDTSIRKSHSDDHYVGETNKHRLRERNKDTVTTFYKKTYILRPTCREKKVVNCLHSEGRPDVSKPLFSRQ